MLSTVSLGRYYPGASTLTRRGCCSANMVGQAKYIDIGGTGRTFYGGKSAHAVHLGGVAKTGGEEWSRGSVCLGLEWLEWSTSSGCSFAAISKAGDMEGSEVRERLVEDGCGR